MFSEQTASNSGGRGRAGAHHRGRLAAEMSGPGTSVSWGGHPKHERPGAHALGLSRPYALDRVRACGRAGRNNVAKLMEQYRDAKLPELLYVLADCPNAKTAMRPRTRRSGDRRLGQPLSVVIGPSAVRLGGSTMSAGTCRACAKASWPRWFGRGPRCEDGPFSPAASRRKAR